VAAHSAVEELGYDSVEYYDLMRASLKRRVLELPELLTDKEMQINRKSPKVRALCELIDFRHSLLHAREGMHRKNIFIEWDGENDPQINLDELMGSELKSIRPRWDVLTLADANKFKMSVLAYDREVLSPAPENIKPGEIIKRTQQQRI
jgi:hypothetical protein